MAHVLKGCRGMLCYLKDIVVFGSMLDEHTQRLWNVSRHISDAGYKLNDRCLFGQKELSFLGHTVSANGLLLLQSNVKAIQETPVPMEIQSIRFFLSMAGFYAKFLCNFSDTVKPLHELLRGEKEFVWTAAVDASFGKVKALISSCSALAMFDMPSPTKFSTDASNYGVQQLGWWTISNCCVCIPHPITTRVEIPDQWVRGSNLHLGHRTLASVSMGPTIYTGNWSSISCHIVKFYGVLASSSPVGKVDTRLLS